MRHLRHRQQRDQPRLPVIQAPRRTKQPGPLVPDAAVPQQLLRERQPPHHSQQHPPAPPTHGPRVTVCNRAHVRVSIAFDPFRPGLLAVPADEHQVRDAMDQHVGHREGVVGIEGDDPDVPADRRRHHHEILPQAPRPVGHPAIDSPHSISQQRQPVPNRHGGFDPAWQPGEVTGGEPRKLAVMRVPVREGIECRQVDRGEVDELPPPTPLTPPRAIQRHPPGLLPHEVKDRQVRQHPPEYGGTFGIERRPQAKRQHWHQPIQPGMPPPLDPIEVRAKRRRVNVRHINQQHRRNPQPLGGGLMQPARQRPHRQQDPRHHRAPQEGAQIKPGREQPRRPAHHPRGHDSASTISCAARIPWSNASSNSGTPLRSVWAK